MKRILALLGALLLMAGCTFQKEVPEPILEYDQEHLLAAEQVEHITMRRGQQFPTFAEPLWGDRQEDRPKIAHILRLIELARPADQPRGTREGLDDQAETLLTVQYQDGRLVQVGYAFRHHGSGWMRSITERMYMPGTGEVIAPELDRFFRGVDGVRLVDLLVPISLLEVEPQEVKPANRVSVSGGGWLHLDQVSLLLLDGATGETRPLGEAAVERGVFTWEGLLPPDWSPGHRGQHAIRLEAGGQEVYRTDITIVTPKGSR